MKFDAYAGNVRDASMRDVEQGLAWTLKGFVSKGPRMRRYGDTRAIEVGGRTAVWIGRDEVNDCIYFEGKGETTPDLVRGVRTHFPKHTVARADICEDYDAEGSFGQLQALVRAHKGNRVKAGYVALPDNPEDGSTWAAGVRGGNAMVRVYEAGKHPDRVHLARPNWARIELEARPHYARDKVVCAQMDAVAFWGVAAWTHRVGEALTQIEIPRYEPEAREWSFDRTTTYLGRAFRRHWVEMLAEGRDWGAIGKELEAVWQADDEAAAKWQRAKGTGPA
jgi:hypothetical protein